MRRDRARPPAGRCEHPGPIEVVAVRGGKRVRCLSCGASGPVREDSAGAIQELREGAGNRDNVGD